MTKRKGLGILLGAALLACLAAGCAQLPPRAAGDPLLATPAHPAAAEAEPGEPGVLASGRGDGTKAVFSAGAKGTQVSWQVRGWTVYESWAAAGVDGDELPVLDAAMEQALQAEPGGGMLLAELTFRSEGRAPKARTEWTYAAGLHPVTGTEVRGRTREEWPGLLHESVYFSEAGEVEVDGQTWSAAFYIPPEGESRRFTMGWVLTAREVEAARDGTLFLWCEEADRDKLSFTEESGDEPLEPTLLALVKN